LTRKDRRKLNVKQALANAETDTAVKKNSLLSVYARDALKYGDKARQFSMTYIGEVPDYFLLYSEKATEVD
jgi:hypothetical protein